MLFRMLKFKYKLINSRENTLRNIIHNWLFDWSKADNFVRLKKAFVFRLMTFEVAKFNWLNK